jgi:hypothetical protein
MRLGVAAPRQSAAPWEAQTAGLCPDAATAPGAPSRNDVTTQFPQKATKTTKARQGRKMLAQFSGNQSPFSLKAAVGRKKTPADAKRQAVRLNPGFTFRLLRIVSPSCFIVASGVSCGNLTAPFRFSGPFPPWPAVRSARANPFVSSCEQLNRHGAAASATGAPVGASPTGRIGWFATASLGACPAARRGGGSKSRTNRRAATKTETQCHRSLPRL